ncbi:MULTISPECIES: hypothetical protein [unclassified Ensifer]|uniref:hypothetical protein n=1 Tax=unclassified Ensifer TaxID=2633371 RepID=UPI000B055565|nr:MULTISPECIES: hypothetical protein [unclassified Ensifer]
MDYEVGLAAPLTAGAGATFAEDHADLGRFQLDREVFLAVTLQTPTVNLHG